MLIFKGRMWVAPILAAGVAACAHPPGAAQAGVPDYKGEPVVHLTFREDDPPERFQDLLTAGLGVAGIQSPTPPQPSDPLNPTSLELRRIAIYNNTRALIDTSSAGGYGRVYGPGASLDGEATGEFIFGDEFLVFSDRGRTENVTMMVQVPLAFDPAMPCIVTGASSGSRGVYGAVGTSGEWGLKRGCAVAYTDKGTGTGAHDLDDDTVNLIQGERADADVAAQASNFTAPVSPKQQERFNQETPFRFAFKHAHSEDNPEALWGEHVLDSIRFAFFILNEMFPEAPKFVPDNTIVIASSVSNGGGAAVLAAEQDRHGLIDGVAVSEPNVNPTFDDRFTIVQGDDGEPLERHSRSLYDYTTLLNVYQGCANLALPGAPLSLLVADELEAARCQSLVDQGLLEGVDTAEQAANAQAIINGYGILEEQNVLQPAQWFLNVPQAIAVTYANAYGRASVLDNLCGYSFAAADGGPPILLRAEAEAIIFGTSSGIPPTGEVDLINNESLGGPLENRFSVSPTSGTADLNLDGAVCLRALALGRDPRSGEPLRGQANALFRRVQQGIEQVRASGDLQGKPAIFVTGRADAVLPPNHTSRAYFGLNRLVEGEDADLRYVEVLDAQHLDALIPLFPTTFIPLHHYFLEALDLMFDHLKNGAPLPDSQVVRPDPRASAEQELDPEIHLPPIVEMPAPGNLIEFVDGEVRIPE